MLGITVDYVDRLLQTQKTVVRPMSWTRKLSNHDPGWFQFESAIALNDGAAEIPENLRIICTWRPHNGDKPATFRFGLFVGASRVYAIDVGPLDQHKNNKSGRGRPMWMKFVGGIHEHLWSDDGDGYGYAEKIELNGIEDIESAWSIFLSKAGLNNSHKFSHPDKAIQSGQKGLEGI